MAMFFIWRHLFTVVLRHLIASASDVIRLLFRCQSWVISTLGTLFAPHSLLEFICRHCSVLSMRTASNICRFVASFLTLSFIFISNCCRCPAWCVWQCFHMALPSIFLLYSSWCLPPLVYPFLAVSPLYTPVQAGFRRLLPSALASCPSGIPTL